MKYAVRGSEWYPVMDIDTRALGPADNYVELSDDEYATVVEAFQKFAEAQRLLADRFVDPLQAQRDSDWLAERPMTDVLAMADDPSDAYTKWGHVVDLMDLMNRKYNKAREAR